MTSIAERVDQACSQRAFRLVGARYSLWAGGVVACCQSWLRKQNCCLAAVTAAAIEMDSAEKRPSSSANNVRQESKWEGQWLFVQSGERAKCLVCGHSVIAKKYNVERHYNSKHADMYNSVQGDERLQLIENLKETVDNEVSSFILIYLISTINIIRVYYVILFLGN